MERLRCLEQEQIFTNVNTSDSTSRELYLQTTETTNARTSSSGRISIGTSPKAISKKDAIPYNYVYCSEAQALA